jgi:hypothetical protein
MNTTIVRFLSVCVVISSVGTAEATSVSAGSGWFASRNDTASGSNTWRYSDPTAADKITWTSGPNTTDGLGHVQNVFGPEQKFTTAPALAGRTFTGFIDNDGPGPSGSTTHTDGAGNSLSVPGTIWGTNWRANWTINATGALGAAPGASWSSQAEALDPLSIFRSQLDQSGVTTSRYDLFFAIGLDGYNLSQLGGAGLSASYQDSIGTTNIINISIDANGKVVTGSDTATFYFLSSLTEGPTEVSANRTSLGGIQSFLNGSNNPLYLGVILEDIPVPTSTLPDGALAQIHINSNAVAAVPEPATWLFMLFGLILIYMLLNHRQPDRLDLTLGAPRLAG